DIAQRQLEAVAVTHIADEKAQIRIELLREALLHLELFQFVAREDDESARLVAFDDRLQKVFTKRARAPGDQDRLVVQIQPWLAEIAVALRLLDFGLRYALPMGNGRLSHTVFVL